MTEAVQNKNVLKLSIADRITIIKSKKYFVLAFSVFAFLLSIGIFGIWTGGGFFRPNVLIGIFSQGLIIGTLATAVSFIYTTGNLDISIGTVLGLAATLGAYTYQKTGNMVLLLIVTMISGVMLMLVNAMLSILFQINTTMVSVVAMQLYSAIISWIIHGDGITVDFSFCKKLETGGFRYISFLIFFIMMIVIFHFTALGRRMKLVGGNENTAKQTGINSNRTVFQAFLLAGVGVGLAAIYSVIRVAGVTNSTGSGLGMDVMLATVLGGMSIFGGAKSNAYSGLIGALTVSALNKGLLMAGVSSTVIQGVRGIIFLILVFLNSERPLTLPARKQF
ncbi:MAG: ABC transporter permease [Candidatus Limivivens sp.]|nr:ABC transporter permease [Candidatus Limivivens sp.]